MSLLDAVRAGKAVQEALLRQGADEQQLAQAQRTQERVHVRQVRFSSQVTEFKKAQIASQASSDSERKQGMKRPSELVGVKKPTPLVEPVTAVELAAGYLGDAYSGGKGDEQWEWRGGSSSGDQSSPEGFEESDEQGTETAENGDSAPVEAAMLFEAHAESLPLTSRQAEVLGGAAEVRALPQEVAWDLIDRYGHVDEDTRTDSMIAERQGWVDWCTPGKA